MHRPNYAELDQLYGEEIIDWSKKYSVHLWNHNPKTLYVAELIKSTPESIKVLNSTFGQIARFVYYGDPNIMKWNEIFDMYIYSS